jgi:hypothetical protein
MPPKKPNTKEQKKKLEKVIEDKTFGMKNKKVGKFVIILINVLILGSQGPEIHSIAPKSSHRQPKTASTTARCQEKEARTGCYA